jgi:hypothetical protein
MPRNMAFLASLAAVVSLAGAVGCSSSSSPAASGGCTTASVSFKTDVMPIFPLGCSLTGVCHGQPGNSGEESLYLGHGADDGINGNCVSSPATCNGPDDIAAAYAAIVGVKALENPQMDLVSTDSNVENSFLWHKVNGDMNSSSTLTDGCKMAAAPLCSDCMDPMPCGAAMPYSNPSLEPDQLCTIKNWIAEGAPNN